MVSTLFARPIKSIQVRPHVGQEINVAELAERPNTFNSSRATLTSSTGSALKEMRSVFPIHLLKRAQIPAALFTVPENKVPDSVIPK